MTPAPDLVGLLPCLSMLAALGAFLALDETAWLQTWLSQPLPAGLLAGWICGDIVTGLALGLPVQLLTLGNLPVGRTAAGERVTPLLGAVGAVCAAGVHLPPFPRTTDLSPVHGWLLLGIAAACLAGYPLLRFERRLNLRWMISGLRGVGGGRLGSLEEAQGRCLAATALRGGVGVLGWFAVCRWAWLPLLDGLPEPIGPALAVVPLLIVPLGAGALIEIYGTRSGLRWMLAGFAVAFAAGWWSM